MRSFIIFLAIAFMAVVIGGALALSALYNKIVYDPPRNTNNRVALSAEIESEGTKLSWRNLNVFYLSVDEEVALDGRYLAGRLFTWDDSGGPIGRPGPFYKGIDISEVLDVKKLDEDTIYSLYFLVWWRGNERTYYVEYYFRTRHSESGAVEIYEVDYEEVKAALKKSSLAGPISTEEDGRQEQSSPNKNR